MILGKHHNKTSGQNETHGPYTWTTDSKKDRVPTPLRRGRRCWGTHNSKVDAVKMEGSKRFCPGFQYFRQSDISVFVTNNVSGNYTIMVCDDKNSP